MPSQQCDQISISANEISISANEISISANEISISANEISISANEISISANEISISANEISISANEISISANEISISANERASVRSRAARSQPVHRSQGGPALHNAGGVYRGAAAGGPRAGELPALPASGGGDKKQGGRSDMTVYQVKLAGESRPIQLANIADLGALLAARLAAAPLEEGDVQNVEVIAHTMSWEAYAALPEWDGGGKDGHGSN